jgi:hypothetical protein
VKLPLTVSVPIELPGARMPPFETRLPIEPVPFNMPPLFSVTVLARLPFTDSVLALTVVGPL